MPAHPPARELVFKERQLKTKTWFRNAKRDEHIYFSVRAGRPSKKKATESGARLATLRKQAGLSQAALAEAVGIPQRTISFYEREAEAIPSTLIPSLAKVLGVSMEELLGINDGGQRAKRCPKSQLDRQLEAVACRAINNRRF